MAYAGQLPSKFYRRQKGVRGCFFQSSCITNNVSLRALDCALPLGLINFNSVRGEKIKVPNTALRSEKEGLYPIQALVYPISLRFKYHFDGSRQTNRLDKVEIF
jgi:hypothetical protein